MSSLIVKLLITHVKREKSLLKLWGQLDQATAMQVYRALQLSKDILEMSPPIHPSTVSTDFVCCVKHTDCRWYRARITRLWSVFLGASSAVEVYFLDYGNTEQVHFINLRLLKDPRLKQYVESFSPQAKEFVLADVVPPGGEWSDSALQIIRETLCYKEVKGEIVGSVDNMQFIRLFTPGNDNELFVNLIIQSGMAVPPGNTSTMPPTLGLSVTSGKELKAVNNVYNTESRSVCTPPGMKRLPAVSNSEVEKCTNEVEVRSASTAYQQSVVQEQYISSSLPPNTEHMVYVSAVETGPTKFAIQLESHELTLNRLLEEINSLQSYEQIIQPANAMPCLAKYSEDTQYYRAIITKVKTADCRVYYVDYGNSEFVSKSDLYVIPKPFIHQKILSIRCSLAELRSEMVVDKDLAKAAFQQLVDEKKLRCKVLPRPKDSDSKCTQIVELYDGGNNILDCMSQKGYIQGPGHLTNTGSKFTYVSVSSGLQDLVMVTFIVGASEFYVQRDCYTEALDDVMEKIGTAQEVRSDPINPENTYIGMPCCTKYFEDDLWYRTEVTKQPSHGQLHVKFVDYGNTQCVPMSTVATLSPAFVRMLPAQSVCCCLDGFESTCSSSERVEQFQQLVCNKSLVCKVKEMKNGVAVVNLYAEDKAHINASLIKMAQRPELKPAIRKRVFDIPSPQVSDIEQIFVTHIETPEYMYGQLKKFDTTHLFDYQKKLARVCRTRGILLYSDGSSHNGEICALPRQDDSSIYCRSKIIREENDYVCVRHLDTGSPILEVAKNKVYRLEEEFLQLHEYGIIVSIEDIPSNLSKKALQNIIVGCVEVKVIQKKDDKYIVRLTDSQLNREAVEKLHGSFQSSAQPYRDSRGSDLVSERGLQLVEHSRGPAERMSRSVHREGAQLINKSRKGSNSSQEEQGHLSSGTSRGSSGNWQRQDKEPIGDGSFDAGTEEAVGRANWGRKKTGCTLSSEGSRADRKPKAWGMKQEQGAVAPPRFLGAGPDANDDRNRCYRQLEIDSGYLKDIDVVYVISPDEFYVQLKEHSNRLKTIMGKINHLYYGSENSGQEINISKGMLCVAKFSEDDAWYRGQITGTWGDEADVYFVDYGNIERMETKRIQKIDNSLLELPSQAVKCALYNAKPKGPTWSQEEVKMFDELTMDKSLIAKFVSQRGDSTYLISIVDASEIERVSTVNRAFQPELSQNCDIADSRHAKQSFQKVEADKVEEEGKRATVGREPFNKHIKKSEERFRDNQQTKGRPMEFVRTRSSDGGNSDKYSGDRKTKSRDGADSAGLSSNQKTGFGDTKFGDKKTKNYNNKPVQSPESDSWETARVPLELPRLKTRFKKLHLSVGLKEKVTLCWILNPGEFYCQLKSSESEFVKLMSDIQMFYGGVSDSDCRETNISIGTPLIVKYKEDSVWYRAEVRRLAGPKVEVIYVDYGNIDIVIKCDIKRMTAEFMELPKQAVRCSLKGVQPLNSLQWPSWNDDVMQKFFGEESYQCEFLKEEGEYYLVDLNDMEIAQKMIDNKMVEAVVEADEQKTDVGNGFPCASLRVLCGQQVLVYVSHIETPLKFWVQLDMERAEAVQAEVETYTSDLQNVGSVPVEVAAPCLARYTVDDSWYRATITEKLSPTELRVYFVDFGNTDDVSLDKLMPISASLLSHPSQAVECSLTGMATPPSAEVVEQFKEAAADTEQTVRIDQIEDCRITVTMFDENENLNEKLGCTVPCLVVNDQALVPSVTVPSFTVQDEEVTVYVSHIETPNSFWIQHVSDTEALGTLNDGLLEFYDTSCGGDDLTDVAVGVLCVAKYSEDSAWYRAKILEVTDNELKVRFIDYGNTDLVQRTDLKVLDSKFTTQPKMALEGSLKLGPLEEKNWSQEAIDRFLEFSGYGEKQLTARVNPCDTKFYVELTSNGENARSIILDNAHELEASYIPVRLCNLPKLSITEGELVDLYVSYIESPSKFCIQLASMSTVLENLMEAIGGESEESLPVCVPCIDDVCLAHFSEDSLVYRAVVKSIHEETVLVKFIDYGNEEEIPQSEIKYMRAEFGKTAALAIDCQLVTEVKGTAWNEAATPQFQKLVYYGEKLLKGRLWYKENVYRTQLFDEDSDLAKELVNEGLDMAEVPPLKIPLDEKIEVSVSHVETPARFWVQLSSYTMQLDDLMDCMAEFYFSSTEEYLVKDAHVGQTCVARYPADSGWYRSRILDIQVDKVQVQYIDYGNCEEVDQSLLRKLDSKFISLPVMGVEVYLPVMPPAGENWTEAAVIAFQGIIEAAADNLSVSLTKVGEKYLVRSCGDPDIIALLVSTGVAERKEEGHDGEEECSVKHVQEQECKVNIEVRKEPESGEGYSETPGTKDSENWESYNETREYESGEEYSKMHETEEPESGEGYSDTPETKEPESGEEYSETCETEEPENGEEYSEMHETKELESGEGYSDTPETKEPESGEEYSEICETKEPESVEGYIETPETKELESGQGYNETPETKEPEIGEGYTERPEAKEPVIEYESAEEPGLEQGSGEAYSETPETKESALEYESAEEPAGEPESVERCETPETEEHLLEYESAEELWVEDESGKCYEREPGMMVVAPVCDEETEREFENEVCGGEMDSQSESVEVKPERREPDTSATLSLLKVEDPVEVFVSHIVSPSQFWVQTSNQSNFLDFLLGQIEAGLGAVVPHPLPGHVYAGWCAESDAWYRAKVMAVHKEAIKVMFIDYGNKETVSVDCVKSIPEGLAHIPPNAVECSLGLTPVDEKWPTEAVTLFRNLVVGRSKLLTARLLQHGDVAVIGLRDGEVNISQVLVEVGFANQVIQFETGGKSLPKVSSAHVRPEMQKEWGGKFSEYSCPGLPPLQIPIGVEVEVTISHSLSPSDLYLQLLEKCPSLDKMMVEMKEHYSCKGAATEMVEVMEEGAVCVTQFSDDGGWYRAKITALVGEKVHVCFVDYGSAEQVEKSMIRKLHDKFTQLPPVGIPCCLRIVPIDGDDWNDAALDAFERITVDSLDVLQAVFNPAGQKYEVQLRTEWQNLAEALVNLDLAKEKEESQEQEESERQNRGEYLEITKGGDIFFSDDEGGMNIVGSETSPCSSGRSASSTNDSSTLPDGKPTSEMLSVIKMDEVDSGEQTSKDQLEVCEFAAVLEHEVSQQTSEVDRTEYTTLLGFATEEKHGEQLSYDYSVVSSSLESKSVHGESVASEMNPHEKFRNSGSSALQYSEENEKLNLNSSLQFELFRTAQEQLSAKLDALIEEPEPECDSVCNSSVTLPFDPFVMSFGLQLTGKLATVEEMTEEEAIVGSAETEVKRASIKEDPPDEEKNGAVTETAKCRTDVNVLKNSIEGKPVMQTELLTNAETISSVEGCWTDAQELDAMNQAVFSELQYHKTDPAQSHNEGLCPDLSVSSKNVPAVRIPEVGKEETEVSVIYCKTPSEFSCLLLRSASEREILDKNLRTYISETGLSKTNDSLKDLCVGTQCILCTDSEGQRAVITSADECEQSEVCVLLLDTGKKQNTSPSKLHPLPESLGSIPAQALRCKLSHVAPNTGDVWGVEACARFEELTHPTEQKIWLKSIPSDDESQLTHPLFRSHEVELRVDGRSIADILTDEGFAKKLTSL